MAHESYITQINLYGISLLIIVFWNTIMLIHFVLSMATSQKTELQHRPWGLQSQKSSQSCLLQKKLTDS